jgi:tetratricopeptide (TPR) repeat protein
MEGLEVKRKMACLVFLAVLTLAVGFLCAEAWGATPRNKDYDNTVKKFVSVVNGKLDAKEALGPFLALDEAKLSVYEQAHRAFFIGDLYFRLGDYEKCKEWTLKAIDDKELYEVPVFSKRRKKVYVHGFTAAAVLANAAAAFGHPEDIDMLESKIPSQDLKVRVFLRYCWSDSPQNSLRTILRFYKALACKNAGKLDEMREILELSSFKQGEIWVGTKLMPIAEAATAFLK